MCATRTWLRAQDILYSTNNSVDAFVIVSNDGDFAPLAQRLRRQGKQVIGVGMLMGGEDKTSAALRSSVDEYIALRPPGVDTQKKVHAGGELGSELNAGCAKSLNDKQKADIQFVCSVIESLAKDPEAQAKFHPRMATLAIRSEDGWVHISPLSQMMDNMRAGWRREALMGHASMRALLESQGYAEALEVLHTRNRGHIDHFVRVRLKGEAAVVGGEAESQISTPVPAAASATEGSAGGNDAPPSGAGLWGTLTSVLGLQAEPPKAPSRGS